MINTKVRGCIEDHRQHSKREHLLSGAAVSCRAKGSRVLSTLPSASSTLPSWKQEVNRRLAEHKNRKGSADTNTSEETHSAADSRAAAAAARVAARYAKAPSYSEMQAAEARAALRAAEAATRAALEAQAAAQAVLDHIEIKATHVDAFETEATAHSQWPAWEATTKQLGEFVTDQPIAIRWEADLPHPLAVEQTRAVSLNSRYSQPDCEDDADTAPIYEAVEAAQPIPANLIQFPREIVASRRMRPRISEAFPDQTSPQQLSIFEVDPNSISTEPIAGAMAPAASPTWIGSSWQQIELDEQPLPDYYAIPPDDAPKLYQAPFGRRMIATMVDTALIVGLVCGVAAFVASQFDHLPGKRISEVCGVLAVFCFAALYEWLFLTFAKVTPGMRYAQLSLCTFDEQIPTRNQVKARLRAMLISVLPVGLGMLWSIFDEDQMSWHDRLSKTYLRLS